jgi:hypothetical protein
MAGFKLDAKARLSIELAPTTGRDDRIFARQQEEDAKARRATSKRSLLANGAWNIQWGSGSGQSFQANRGGTITGD